MDRAAVVLRDGVELSSKDTFGVCNLQVHVYGLDRIKTKSPDNLTIVTVLHPRGYDWRHSEIVSHELLHYYYSHGGSQNVIAVGFDLWNHGSRRTDKDRNLDWMNGNKSHAQDLLTMIQGSAQDASLVMDVLPAYLPFCVVGKGIRHVVTGASLGGHTCWRVAQIRGKAKLHAMAPMIATPYLSLMLLRRLKYQVPGDNGAAVHLSASHDHHMVSARNARSKLGKEAQKYWPESLHELALSLDSLNVEDGIKVFILNGENDPSIPPKYSEQFYERNKGNKDIKLFVQPNTVHSCTPEMLDRIGQWLLETVVG
jgi:pimeloyl-ACP methyl ester carboxylesterase